MSGAGSLPMLMEEISAWALPALAAPHIAAGLRTETARLVLQGRTASRAQRLLAAQLGSIDPNTLDPADITLLTGDAAQLDTIAARAGCVWHGARVRALLRGADIAALVGRFGEAARRAALEHAPPVTVPPGSDDLAADIMTDGTHCIDAWIEDLPLPARSRMRLVRPAPEAIPDHTVLRAALVRRLAADVKR